MAVATAVEVRPLEFAAFKPAIDPALAESIAQHLADCERLQLDPAVLDLVRYGANLALAGGKRIRPYVAYLAYASNGGTNDEDVVPALVGLELFHVFALIHDDWMDHGVTRHGQACLHRYAAESLAASGARAAAEVGAAQAVLIGDLVFNWSMQDLLRHVPAERLPAVLDLFHAMVNEVVAGQMLDVDTMARQEVSAAAVARKTELKSARYTFVNPMKIGAALAGVDGSALAETLGTALGLAFQLQDDLLDIVGNSVDMGKGVLSDLREHQHTFFTQHIKDCGTAGQRAELRSFIGRELDAHEAQSAVQLFQDSGAIAAGRAEIERCFSSAKVALEKSAFSAEHRAHWSSFIHAMEQRTS